MPFGFPPEAHLLLKPGDVAMAHGFIGFFGDLWAQQVWAVQVARRLLQQSIEGSKLAAWIVHLRRFRPCANVFLRADGLDDVCDVINGCISE